MYTCPGATMVSGKLIIANNTGGAAAVDVAIVEQTDIIQILNWLHQDLFHKAKS